jgi:hypothetical protein
MILTLMFGNAHNHDLHVNVSATSLAVIQVYHCPFAYFDV